MKKIDVDKLLEKAEITKDKSRDDISLYEVDLRPAGYNTVLTVHAKTKAAALASATETLKAHVDNPMTPDLPLVEKK